MRAYTKDTLRNISHSKKRFLAIALITLLGVMMFSGLQASCNDLEKSADAFFDAQKLHDIQIQSTLGLTEDDLTALRKDQDVEQAAGIQSISADITATEKDNEENTVLTDASVTTLDDAGIDAPYLLKGNLPASSDEALLTEKTAKDSGLSIGGQFTVSETNTSDTTESDTNETVSSISIDNESNSTVSDSKKSGSSSSSPALSVTTFTVCGIVTDPTDMDNPFGQVSYRSSQSSSDKIFVEPEAVDGDIYTSVVISLKDSVGYNCYSDAYSTYVNQVQKRIENEIRPSAEDRRTEEVREKAQQALDDSIREAEDALQKQSDEAQQKLSAAEAQLYSQQNTAGTQPNTQEDTTQAQQYTQENAAGAQQSAQENPEAQKAQLEQQLQDAQDKIDTEKEEQQQKIDDMSPASWYVMNRSALSGWSNIQNDADSIASIGVVFPIVFFAVAILISLTAVARMIDEDRGLLGTYKFLGFTNQEILGKYLLYAGLAGLTGSIGGTILAFAAFPAFLFTVFRMMYLLPSYTLSIMPIRAILGPALFVGGILLTTIYSCYKELRQSAAALMRPKSPKPGSRVFLERITPIWKHMSFLRKVTARNLFRYKSRMLMTILGIGGCMALLLFGFALRDSVAELSPGQYDRILHYGLMAVSDETGSTATKTLDDAMDSDLIREYTNVAITSAKIQTSKGESNVSLIVFPDAADTSEYVNFDKTASSDTRSANLGAISTSSDTGNATDSNVITSSANSSAVSFESTFSGSDSSAAGMNNSTTGTDNSDSGALKTGEIYVTQNAATLLDFSAGDQVSCRLPDLSEADLTITAIVRNYIGNYIYMNASTYRSLFGDPSYNAVLACFQTQTDSKAQKDFGSSLKSKNGIQTVMVTSELMEQSADTFRLMNVVVAIIILMSAALAFVVLFTLQTTNISERERELATIKVLGFYDREVHQYINRETWFLTILGVLVGLPLGWLFAQTISVILKLPSITLEVYIHPVSYLYSALLTLLFAFLVQLITNRTLNKIDPATALKSVE
ncbi:MAG: FtsX-like permease family protein [Bilifractor sp.]